MVIWNDIQPLFRPKIVCLCGSTKFKDEFEKAQLDETLKGNIVLTVGAYFHCLDDNDILRDVISEKKKMLDKLHLSKIDICDEVFVINVDGYIGFSTQREIRYAVHIGKPVRYLIPTS